MPWLGSRTIPAPHPARPNTAPEAWSTPVRRRAHRGLRPGIKLRPRTPLVVGHAPAGPGKRLLADLQLHAGDCAPSWHPPAEPRAPSLADTPSQRLPAVPWPPSCGRRASPFVDGVTALRPPAPSCSLSRHAQAPHALEVSAQLSERGAPPAAQRAESRLARELPRLEGRPGHPRDPPHHPAALLPSEGRARGRGREHGGGRQHVREARQQWPRLACPVAHGAPNAGVATAPRPTFPVADCRVGTTC